MTTETGWLIEIVAPRGVNLWLTPELEPTKDASKAWRFARQCDGQAFLDLWFKPTKKKPESVSEIFAKHFSRDCYAVTEHMWMDGP